MLIGMLFYISNSKMPSSSKEDGSSSPQVAEGIIEKDETAKGGGGGGGNKSPMLWKPFIAWSIKLSGCWGAEFVQRWCV